MNYKFTLRESWGVQAARPLFSLEADGFEEIAYNIGMWIYKRYHSNTTNVGTHVNYMWKIDPMYSLCSQICDV